MKSPAHVRGAQNHRVLTSSDHLDRFCDTESRRMVPGEPLELIHIDTATPPVGRHVRDTTLEILKPHDAPEISVHYDRAESCRQEHELVDLDQLTRLKQSVSRHDLTRQTVPAEVVEPPNQNTADDAQSHLKQPDQIPIFKEKLHTRSCVLEVDLRYVQNFYSTIMITSQSMTSQYGSPCNQ